MKKILHKAWRHVLITGICSLLFGIIALLWPAIPLFTLVWLFAGFMILEGITIIAGAWETRKDESRWWLLMFYGVLCVITGVTAAAYPGLTTVILGFIISINLLLGGIVQVVMAIHLRKEISNEGWLILSGIFTAAAGIYLLAVPGGGALAMLWMIAVAAIFLGVFFILLALKAKRWFRDQMMPG
jgi:uncharacterized membrane protein HdeD (DUF308 family)